MISINKIKTQFGDWIRINTDDGSFEIDYCGNQDLYWKYVHNGDILTSNSKTFYITKENYFLFSLFDKLYNDVISYNIFDEKKYNDKLISYDLNNPNKLVQNNCIRWHSDDFDYDEASAFVIEKCINYYKLTFEGSKNKMHFLTYDVRIRNSGSRYHYFDILFMNMYRELCKYDFDYQQIHMEEYLYYKNKVKKKETI